MAQEQGKPRVSFKPTKQSLDEHAPWKPTAWEPADAGAIQALVRGDAPPHLQMRAMQFIINQLCGTYDLPYRPGGPEGERDTDFALGKMWVGQQLVKLTKVKIVHEGEQS